MNLLFANDRDGAYPPSYYAAVAPPLPAFAPLAGEVRADVCVIGGGYTGLSAALHLAQAGRRVVVLDAQRMGFGASGRNGGQVLGGQRLDQIALERMVGRDDARKLWDSAVAAVALVRNLIAEGGIDCDWQTGAIHAELSKKGAAGAADYANHLNRHYGYDQALPLDRAALRAIVNTERYAGGVLDGGSGHINPLAFALGLARMAEGAGASLHERSLVTGIAPGKVTTAQGHVLADQIVLACNGYLGALNRGVAARVMPINNFIAATEPLPPGTVLNRRVCVADSNFVVNYYRTTADNRLLFGGGETYGYRFPSDIAALVRGPMARTFPQLADVKITHAWGGTLAITMNRMPHFVRPAPGVWSASGYSGHGVATATWAGKMIAQAIAGDADGFDLMARVPTPRFPGGAMLRWPLLVSAMTWFGMRDRLGF